MKHNTSICVRAIMLALTIAYSAHALAFISSESQPQWNYEIVADEVVPEPGAYIDIVRGWQSSGSVTALLDMGRLYWQGSYQQNVSPDPERALSLIRSAANRGSGAAADFLGDLYWSGDRVEISVDRAVFWYEVAAHNGSTQSAFKLGEIFSQGARVTPDLPRAVQYFTVAANAPRHASASAQARLGFWYVTGHDGVDKNVDLGLSYLAAAASREDINAKYNYAVIVLSGDYPSRVTRAMSMLEAAARAGHPQAAYLAASLYYTGRFVGRNLIKAREFLALAPETGPVRELRAEMSAQIERFDVERSVLLGAIKQKVESEDERMARLAAHQKQVTRAIRNLALAEQMAAANDRALHVKTAAMVGDRLSAMLETQGLKEREAMARVAQSLSVGLSRSHAQRTQYKAKAEAVAAQALALSKEQDDQARARREVAMAQTRNAVLAAVVGHKQALTKVAAVDAGDRRKVLADVFLTATRAADEAREAARKQAALARLAVAGNEDMASLPELFDGTGHADTILSDASRVAQISHNMGGAEATAIALLTAAPTDAPVTDKAQNIAVNDDPLVTPAAESHQKPASLIDHVVFEAGGEDVSDVASVVIDDGAKRDVWSADAVHDGRYKGRAGTSVVASLLATLPHKAEPARIADNAAGMPPLSADVSVHESADVSADEATVIEREEANGTGAAGERAPARETVIVVPMLKDTSRVALVSSVSPQAVVMARPIDEASVTAPSMVAELAEPMAWEYARGLFEISLASLQPASQAP